MTDYRTGDFLTGGNGLFQITATKESYFLLDVNEGTLILASSTEAGLVKTYESLYDCHFKGPGAYEMAFECKNRFGGKVIRVNELEVDYVPNASLFDDDEEDEENY